jgi:hypothetical protein
MCVDGPVDLVEDVVEVVLEEAGDLAARHLDVLLDLRVDLAVEVVEPARPLSRGRRRRPCQHDQGSAHVGVSRSHWFSPDTMRAAPS